MPDPTPQPKPTPLERALRIFGRWHRAYGSNKYSHQAGIEVELSDLYRSHDELVAALEGIVKEYDSGWHAQSIDRLRAALSIAAEVKP